MSNSMIKLLFKGLLVDRRLMEELYQKRRAVDPSVNNRTRLAIGLTGVLFVAILGFLMMMAWSQDNIESLIRAQPYLESPTELLEDWSISNPIAAHHCTPIESCRNALRSQIQGFPKRRLTDFEYQPATDATPNESSVIFMRRSFPVASLLKFSGRGAAVLVLPAFQYQQAHLTLGPEKKLSRYNGKPLVLEFFPEDFAGSGDTLELELLLQVPRLTRPMIDWTNPRLNQLERSVSLATLTEYSNYERIHTAKQVGRGDFVGALARIIMAVFVLALFLLIDGSPETLGLALMMGFEGAAISIGFGWLPFAQASIIQHYCFQMGDIMRLFFFLQLARVISPRLTPWITWGTALSIPYGILRYYSNDPGFLWATQIPNIRDIAVGMIGAIVCLRSAFILRNRQIPWRVAALLIAGVSSIEQTLDPITHYSAWLGSIQEFTAAIDALQPLSAWLMALSAFINVSTLENRVHVLSKLAIRAQLIEQEMQLAKAVQKSFLNLPELPKSVHLACHHEAMLYVSGDTYFADWNEDEQKLTFIINDVTGHGVQAALKASGVTEIAKAVWNSEVRNAKTGRMQAYANRIEEFYVRLGGIPDIVALGGAEFDTVRGEVTLYRRNFPFPILISPRDPEDNGPNGRKGDLWSVQLLNIPNDTEVKRQLPPGSTVVVSSDGFLDSSRRAAHYMRFLRKKLADGKTLPTAENVRTWTLECRAFESQTLRDDRTLTVFHWQGPDSRAKSAA